MKLAINAWIVTVVQGAAETLALAEGMGLDPSLVLEALEGGPLDLPYLRLKAKAMIASDFEPAFRLALAAKDARLAVAAGDERSLDLPVLRVIAERLSQAAREHGEEDFAATFLLSSGDGS